MAVARPLTFNEYLNNHADIIERATRNNVNRYPETAETRRQLREQLINVFNFRPPQEINYRGLVHTLLSRSMYRDYLINEFGVEEVNRWIGRREGEEEVEEEVQPNPEDHNVPGHYDGDVRAAVPGERAQNDGRVVAERGLVDSIFNRGGSYDPELEKTMMRRMGALGDLSSTHRPIRKTPSNTNIMGDHSVKGQLGLRGVTLGKHFMLSVDSVPEAYTNPIKSIRSKYYHTHKISRKYFIF